MKIEQYLNLYEEYRKSFFDMKEARENAEKSVFSAWGEFFSPSFNIKKLEEDYRRRERILKNATARLSAAISRIGDTALQNVLICKYFYNFKVSEIATHFSYCERHIYRLLKDGKKRLEKELLKLMPSPRPTKEKKVYRYKNKTSEIVHKKGA